MAITVVSKIAEATSSNAASYPSSASLTPADNKVYLLAAIVNNAGGSSTNPSVPTATGAGLTWANVISFNIVVWKQRITVFRALGASGLTDTVTVTYGATQDGHVTFVEELTGTKLSGGNASDAIVQTASAPVTEAASTSGSVTLAAFADAANNLAYGVFSIQANETITKEASYSGPTSQGHANPTRAAVSEWIVGQDLAVTASWTSSVNWRGVALEIAAAAAGASTGHRGLALWGAG